METGIAADSKKGEGKNSGGRMSRNLGSPKCYTVCLDVSCAGDRLTYRLLARC